MPCAQDLAEADPFQRPMLIVNGELDRIRSGYYPPIFYPPLIGIPLSPPTVAGGAV